MKNVYGEILWSVYGEIEVVLICYMFVGVYIYMLVMLGFIGILNKDNFVYVGMSEVKWF